MEDPERRDPFDAQVDLVVGKAEGTTLFDHGKLACLVQAPSPGIVIFVHGVNSDYTASTFIGPQAHFSPLIQFRWGYKASDKELQQYGDSVYLNEYAYWGGGPFANGCSSLPDLWGEGLSDALFLFIHIEHLNPVNDRIVYACPPRPYFVLAALRLAHLVAAAFLGNKMAEVQDAAGKSGRCVADTYVLCNPPYSLLRRNDTEGWLQGQVRDVDGNVGRQSGEARRQTLAAFFDIVRGQAKFDFNKQTFNMPALLGETGAGTALTNVALAIAYANHVGRPVLVAGSSDSESVTAVVVAPPAVVRPIDHEQPWFRARGGNTVFLPWWGRRFDARPGSQGYSR